VFGNFLFRSKNKRTNRWCQLFFETALNLWVNDRELLRAVGRKIRAERVRVGLTQECLAELAGIHWKTLGRIERAEFAFSIIIFSRLAQHLDVDPTELLGELGKPDAKRSSRIIKALARKRTIPKV
jgi:DNA-binding XRE family transcriptional regulator